jgi:excisionase family DNA binding protein
MRVHTDKEIADSETETVAEGDVGQVNADCTKSVSKGPSSQFSSANGGRGQLKPVAIRATLSLAEAAQVLGIHRTTAWSLLQRGQFPIPVLKVGSRNRVVESQLRQFLETGEPIVSGAPIASRVANGY